MTPVDEAVERVRGYVESWDGFDDGTIISDNCDPNDLILSDLRALLSALELGSVASLPRHSQQGDATPSEREQLKRFKDWWRWLARQAWDDHLTPEEAIGIIRHHPTVSDMHAALSASTTDSGSVADEAELERHVAEALADHDGISLASEEAREIYRSAAAVAIKTYRLRAPTTDSGKVDHYRDDTALKFPTGEGGGS